MIDICGDGKSVIEMNAWEARALAKVLLEAAEKI